MKRSRIPRHSLVIVCMALHSVAFAAQVTVRLVDGTQVKRPPVSRAARQAPGRQMVTWAHGLQLGRHPFDQWVKKGGRRTLVRRDAMTLELADGAYRIGPVGSEVVVKGDAVSSKDPNLVIRGNVVEIPLYAVTFRAVPLVGRGEASFVPRIRYPDGPDGKPGPVAWFVYNKPVETLTLYLPAADGYRTDLFRGRFDVGAKGVELRPEKGVALVRKSAPSEVTVHCLPVHVTFFTSRGSHVSSSRAALYCHVSDGASGAKLARWIAYRGAEKRCCFPRSEADLVLRQEERERACIDRGKGQYKWVQGPRWESPVTFDNRDHMFNAVHFHIQQERYPGPIVLRVGWNTNVRRAAPGNRLAIRLHDPRKRGATRGLHLAAYVRPNMFSMYDESAWQRRPLAPDRDDEHTLNLAGVTAGVYSLRIVAGRASPPSPDETLRVETPMLVTAPAKKPWLFVFTDRQRHAFLEGERIQVNVCLRNPGARRASTLTLTLRQRSSGRRRDARPVEGRPEWTLVTQELPALPAGSHTRSFWLDAPLSRMLEPGGYELVAAVGGLRSTPYRLTIASRRRRARLPAGAWSCGGRLNLDVPTTPENLNRMRDTVEKLYLRFGHPFVNSEVGNGPMFRKCLTRDTSFLTPAESAGLDPGTLPPEELYHVPSLVDQTMEQLLLDGCMHHAPTVYHDNPGFETHEPGGLGIQDRKMQIYAQYFRKWPNWMGLHQSEWATLTYCMRAGLPPEQRPRAAFQVPTAEEQAACRRLLWQEFARKYSVEGGMPTSWPKYGQVPAGGAITRENPDLWVKWADYIAGLMGKIQIGWRAKVESIVPFFVHTNGYAFPGFSGQETIYDPQAGGYSPGMDPVRATRGLTVMAPIGEGKDRSQEGYRTGMVPDLYDSHRELGLPVWRVGWGARNLDKASLLRDVLWAWSRGAVPINSRGFYGGRTFEIRYATDTADHGFYGWPEHYAAAMEMLDRFGDIYFYLREERDTAILCSFTNGALDRMARNQTGHNLHQLWVAVQLAGHSPAFVYERDIRAGRLDGYRALVLTRTRHDMGPEVMGAIQRFITRGGLVLADRETTLAIPGARRLPLSFNEWYAYARRGWFKEVHGMKVDQHAGWGFFFRLQEMNLPKLPVLKRELDRTGRTAWCDNPHLFLNGHRCGPVRYLFAVNTTAFPTAGDSPRPRPLARGETRIVPLRQRLFMPDRDCAVYDLFEGRTLPVTRKDGVLSFEADLTRTAGGKLFAILDRPPARVDLAASAEVTAGQRAQIEVRTLDDRGRTIAGPIPLEVTLTDPKGRTVEHLFRSTGTAFYRDSVRIPINAPAGGWTLSVRELLSGRAAAVTIRVRPVKDVARLVAARVKKAEDVDVFDAAHVARFLQTRPKITIPLGSTDPAAGRLAKRVAGALGARAIQADVQPTDALVKGVNLFLPYWFSQKRPFILYPKAKIDRDMIVVSVGRSHPLAADANRGQILPRHISESFPGRGRGLIQYAWSPFGADRDAVFVIGGDEAGLAKAVDRLLSLADADPVKLRDNWSGAMEQARWSLFPEDFRQSCRRSSGTVAAEDDPVRASTAGLVHGKPVKGLPPLPRVAERVGASAYALAVSPDRKTLCVGVDAEGRNILLVDTQGRLLAAGRTRQRLVHRVGWSASGKHVVAADVLDASVQAIDAATGKELWRKEAGANHLRYLTSEFDMFAASPTEDRVLVAEEAGRVVCCEAGTGRAIWSLPPPAGEKGDCHRQFTRLVISPDGRRAAVTMRRFATKVAKKKLADVSVHRLIQKSAPEGVPVATVYCVSMKDGKVMWRVDSEPEVAEHYNLGNRMAFGPDGVLAITDDVGGIVLVDAQGKTVASLAFAEMAEFEAGVMRFSPDGRKLALVGVQDARERLPLSKLERGYILDIPSRRLAMLQFPAVPNDLLFLPNGGFLVSCWDKTVRQYDGKGSPVRSFPIPGGARLALVDKGGCVVAATSLGFLVSRRLDGAPNWQRDLLRDAYADKLWRVRHAMRRTSDMLSGDKLRKMLAPGCKAGPVSWRDLGAAWRGLAPLVVRAKKPGAAIEFVYDAKYTDRYAIRVAPVMGLTFGTARLRVDGQPVGDKAAGYADQPAWPGPRTKLAVVPMRRGKHRVALQVTGRDEESHGFDLGVCALKIEPVGTFVRTWSIIGTFPGEDGKAMDTRLAPEVKIDLDTTHQGKEGDVRWRQIDARAPTSGPRWTDFYAWFEAGHRDSVAYAVNWIRSPEDRRVRLGTSGNFFVRYFINGKRVLKTVCNAQPYPDQHVIEVRLRKGWNKVLVKVGQPARASWMESGFFFHLSDPGDLVYRNTPPRE